MYEQVFSQIDFSDYSQVLEKLNDRDFNLHLWNIIESYINLGLYEDALTFCDGVLNVDSHHFGTLFAKAECLSNLMRFDEAQEVLNMLDNTYTSEVNETRRNLIKRLI